MQSGGKKEVESLKEKGKSIFLFFFFYLPPVVAAVAAVTSIALISISSRRGEANAIVRFPPLSSLLFPFLPKPTAPHFLDISFLPINLWALSRRLREPQPVWREEERRRGREGPNMLKRHTARSSLVALLLLPPAINEHLCELCSAF